ncbi:MAG: 39S ribosomal protein L45 [Coriobacteriales bacterium]|jgi:predicted lipid-binding transport protein (Tim44 family)|nr:39S ribosomal protein L45 [Coriobacteriales bacterium]
MRNRKSILLVLMLCLALGAALFIALPTLAAADLGGQNDFGSGSDFGFDSGSSSWDSGSSSWDSGGSWDSGSSYWGGSDSFFGGSSSSSSGSASLLGMLLCLVPLLIGIVVLFIIFFSRTKTPTESNYVAPYPTPPDQQALELKVKERDPDFNASEFLGWVREAYMELSAAWSSNNAAKLRLFETNNLFNEHSAQIQQYINQGSTNVVDQIGIRACDLKAFTFDEQFEYLAVTMHAQQIDYVRDIASGRVLRGDPGLMTHMYYTLVFKRTAGEKTPLDIAALHTSNCPNCGAPLQVKATGQCEFCGTILMTGEYGWALDSFTGKRMGTVRMVVGK